MERNRAVSEDIPCTTRFIVTIAFSRLSALIYSQRALFMSGAAFEG